MEHPARITPPTRRPRALSLIRTIVRNPLEAWPAAIYTEDLVRTRFLGHEAVFVSAPELIQQVLVEQADAFVRDAATRRALVPALGEGILTADGARWRWQRRAAAPVFRHERLLGFVPAMQAAAARTAARWRALPEGAEVDVAREMMRTTFDVILETMLSSPGGVDVALAERNITDYLESTTWAIALALLRVPSWTPYPGRARAEAARDWLRAETLRIVAERRAQGEAGGDDLLALLLAARDPETGQAMSDRDLADNLLTFIAAGHETTALALAWTFYLLALHPEAEARILEEVERVAPEGEALREAHVAELAWTRQVVQEAMRLYPPAPIITRTATRDVALGGIPLAAGTTVNVPIYAVHRHAKLWDEPDRFDPGRFRPEAVRARHRYAYLPFGAGPRICIGMSFAMIEAVVMLATLVRAASLELRPGFVPGLRQRITLRPVGGMPMRLRRAATIAAARITA